MRVLSRLAFAALLFSPLVAWCEEEPLFNEKLNVVVPPLNGDPALKIEYDIAYVRAQRAGDEVHKRYFTDFSSPLIIEPGADLILLHPDGSEELLVAGGQGSITDPVVSFDGQWIYYVHIHNLQGNPSQWSPPHEGADIYKVNVNTKKLVRLTNQKLTPNLRPTRSWMAWLRGANLADRFQPKSGSGN
jgi:hypothetical protein